MFAGTEGHFYKMKKLRKWMVVGADKQGQCSGAAELLT